MDCAKQIKELRESTGLSRKEFSVRVGIPVRTLEDWEAGRRTPPEYIPRLIAYQLKYEELVQMNVKSAENGGRESE
jgi:transcriptional regulator with XRE-family HTH domain